LEGKRTARNKAKTRHPAFRTDVQGDPAQGLCLHLNPRTGKTHFEGGGQPEVREVLQQHLRGDDFLRYRGTLDYFLCLRRASWRNRGTRWQSRAIRKVQRAYASPGDGIRDDHMRTHAPPDFPTCDVQGVEVKVFRRAQRLLKEKRPGIICGIDSEEKQRDGLERFLPFAYTWQPCGTNHLLALPQ
jgi:hypothetical protein